MSKILLIEDSPRTSSLFAKCLRSEGYHTLAALNGLEGVRLIASEQPDLVICDVLMPQLDGYAVLSRLRSDPATAVTPFIFLTARCARAEIRYGMELGADDYLTKPCSFDEILKAVSTRLDKQKSLRQWYSTECQILQPDLRAQGESQSSPEPASIFPTLPKLEKIFTYIEAHFCQPITLDDVAQATNYSPAYMTHLVKRKTQRSVYCWILERRMVEARKLLLEDRLSVKEVALQIGYSDPGYFTRQFKQYHQVSPKTWRQQNTDPQR